MSHLHRLLALLSVALLATLAPSFAQTDSDETGGGDCSGCEFLVNGPNYGNNGAPNPCGTDLRVTIMGFSGSCDVDDDGNCGQSSPCFVGIQVEYRSTCRVDFDFEVGALGNELRGQFSLPGTEGGGWQDVIPPWVEAFPCGGTMRVLKIEIKDLLGYFKFARAQYWCAACD